MRDIKYIVIHCAATPNGDGRFTLEDLDRMHRDRGWRKIGYHYVIEVSGACRTGRLEHEIGAHVAGSNASSIGVCMIGTDKFTLEQWESLQSLITSLQLHYPEAEIVGHRDFSPDKDGDGIIEEWEWLKTCPGFDVRTWMLAGKNPLWNSDHVVAAK